MLSGSVALPWSFHLKSDIAPTSSMPSFLSLTNHLEVQTGKINGMILLATTALHLKLPSGQDQNSGKVESTED